MDKKSFFSQITAFADVHSLTIPEVFEEDTGNYAVRAVNRAGEASCAARLSVEPEEVPQDKMDKEQVQRREARPFFQREQPKTSPPEMKRRFQDVSTILGECVTFECEVTGTPKPKVSFDQDVYFFGF